MCVACDLSVKIKMLYQNLRPDADQDQSADQVQFEIDLAAEVVSEVDSESREQECDDPYCQGFQRNGRFDAGQ